MFSVSFVLWVGNVREITPGDDDEPARPEDEDDGGKGRARREGLERTTSLVAFTELELQLEFFARGWLIGVFARSSREIPIESARLRLASREAARCQSITP